MTQVEQVYIITSGSYSDYSISSVWLTLQDAKTALGDDKDDRIEIYPIGARKRTLGGFHYTGDFDSLTGQVLDEHSYDSPALEPPRSEIICWAGKDRIGIRVTQETQERASKIYGELSTQVLAHISEGFPPEAIANSRYENGRWIPQKPGPIFAQPASSTEDRSGSEA